MLGAMPRNHRARAAQSSPPSPPGGTYWAMDAPGSRSLSRRSASPVTKISAARSSDAVALEHGCHYCTALHSALLAQSDLVVALRLFTREVVRTRARPDWSDFTAAGFTETNALDVVLGVGVYTLSTYLNILTEAEIDPAFAAFA